MAAYWLVKTEPETFSISDLERDHETFWDGVRNFQARNHLLNMKKGDWVLIYHSVTGKAVVGIGKVKGAAIPDPDPKRKGEWVKVPILFQARFKNEVPLSQIKQEAKLQNLALLKQSRLSVMPVSESEFSYLKTLGGL